MAVGRVGRPHGLDGSVHVDGAGGVVRLVPGTTVAVGDAETAVVARKGTDERPVVRFALAADRDAAEALRGLEVTVPVEALPAPEEDEYYHLDLVGCAVVAGGTVVGRVADVLPYPANDVLVLDDGVTLVPFVADAVEAVDVRGRRVTLREGFL